MSFATDEGSRFVHRDRLNPVVAAAIGARDLAALAPAFDAGGVTWAPYRGLSEALAEDPRAGASNPILSSVEHVSGATYLTPGAPATLPTRTRRGAERAPHLGEHTEEMLGEVLGLASATIGDLVARGVAGLASPTA